MTHWRDRFKVVPAVYVIFERDAKVLLLLRAGTGYMDGYYSLPAGHLDGGEAATTAASREAVEEVGIRVDPDSLELRHVMHRLAMEGDHERLDMYFGAPVFDGEPENMEPEKCAGLVWAAYDELPENIVPEVKYALESIGSHHLFSGYNFPTPGR